MYHAAGRDTGTRVADYRRAFQNLSANIQRFIRGKPAVVDNALYCLLAGGHLLIEDVPGVAKTSLARAIAQSVDAEVKRIQFTPDLLPADVTGAEIYEPSTGGFSFRPGPIFTNILLGDEINRASPKTQSALLEVMAEGRVTVAGRQMAVPRPFLCIATQNPTEYHGTYPLPEAQLDRFMMRLAVGYPEPGDEVDILVAGIERRTPEQLESVMRTEDLLDLTETATDVYVAPDLAAYIVDVSGATRRLPELRLGASPRATIALGRCAQARAAAEGRAFAIPDDVKAVAAPVLNHRLIVRPEAAASVSVEELVAQVLTRVRVPREVRA